MESLSVSNGKFEYPNPQKSQKSTFPNPLERKETFGLWISGGEFLFG
jgi:hypothetical protein